MNDFEVMREDEASRRAFLKRMTAAGLGAAALAILSPSFAFAASRTRTRTSTSAGTSDPFTGIPGRTIDEQILNFALTAEIIEADLYRQALNKASGLALTTPLNSDPSVYHQTVSNGVLSSNAAAAGYLYLVQFAYVEAAHRDFLTAAIQSGGGTPVMARSQGYQFPGGLPSDLFTILSGYILPLEEGGVRAYLGALPYFTSLSLAQTAATIFSTEARHSAALQYTTGHDPGPSREKNDRMVVAEYPHNNTFEYVLDPQTVISRLAYYFA